MEYREISGRKVALLSEEYSKRVFEILRKKESERLLARALRKTLIGASWEKQALEAYDKACELTNSLTAQSQPQEV